MSPRGASKDTLDKKQALAAQRSKCKHGSMHNLLADTTDQTTNGTKVRMATARTLQAAEDWKAMCTPYPSY
jgi:hypothetical protein